MPEILRAVETRRAKRAISDRRIPREIAESLLSAAPLAPSCANNQPWRLIAIDDPQTLAATKEHLLGGNYWARPAPLIVAVASRVDLDCEIPDGRQYYLFGCGLAAMNLMTQATELGLVAHPIAGYRQAPLKQTLGVADDYTIIALIIIAYPGTSEALSEKHLAEENSPRIRRPLDAVVQWNRFDFDDPSPSSK